jgi:hypothetical protein
MERPRSFSVVTAWRLNRSFDRKIKHDPHWSMVAGIYLATHPSVHPFVYEPVGIYSAFDFSNDLVATILSNIKPPSVEVDEHHTLEQFSSGVGLLSYSRASAGRSTPQLARSPSLSPQAQFLTAAFTDSAQTCEIYVPPL